MQNLVPILEFDPTLEAMIEPSKTIRPRDIPEHCVITFFLDVIQKIVTEHQAVRVVENRWEDGPHPIYEFNYKGKRVAFLHPGVGAPLSAGIQRLQEIP